MPTREELIASIPDPELRARLMAGPKKANRDVTNIADDPLQFAQDLARNAYLDVKDVITALTKLPDLAVMLAKHPIDTAGEMLKGILYSYKDLLSDPVGTFAHRPVTSVLDAMAGLGVGAKVLRMGGVAAQAAGKTGPVSQVLRSFAEKGISADRMTAASMAMQIQEDVREAIAITAKNVAKRAEKYRTLPKDTGQRMMAAAEGTRFWDDPLEATAADNLKILKDRLGAKVVAEELRDVKEAFEGARQALNDNGLLAGVPKLEQYLTHAYKPKPGFEGSFGGTIRKLADEFHREGFDVTAARSWRTFDDAVRQAGLVPRFNNPWEAFQFYITQTKKAEAHAKTVRELGKLRGEAGDKMVSTDHFPGAVRVNDPQLAFTFMRPFATEVLNARIAGRPLAPWVMELDDGIKKWMLQWGAEGGTAGRAAAVKHAKMAQATPEFLSEIGFSKQQITSILRGDKLAKTMIRNAFDPKLLKITEDAATGMKTAVFAGDKSTFARKLLQYKGHPNVFQYTDNAQLYDQLRQVRKSIQQSVRDAVSKKAVGHVETQPVFIEMPKAVYMHPEIAEVYKQIAHLPTYGEFATAFSRVNAIAKKLALSFSLFHHGALTESAVATLGLKGIPLPLYGGKLPHKRGLAIMEDIKNNAELNRFNVVGGSVDAQRTLVKQALENFGTYVNAKVGGTFGSKVAGKIQRVSDWWDRGLWDHYHTGLKAYAYFELKNDMLKRFGKRFTETEISRKVATFVNDAFGGLNWNEMMISPRMQRQLSWLLLAPDWTLANIRIAARPARAALKSLKKGVGLAKEGGDPIVLALGARYWRNMIASQFLFGNAANKLFSAYNAWARNPDQPFDLNKGHWMNDNDEGNKFNIVSPFGKDERGRNKYIKLGKQMREPLRWVENPVEVLGAKMSPALKMLWEQVSGASPSGYPAEWKDQPFMTSIPSRIKGVGEAFVPISEFGFSPTSFMSIAPMGAATTGYKLVAAYKEALERKQFDKIAKLNTLAARNGYKPGVLLSLAKRELKKGKSKK